METDQPATAKEAAPRRITLLPGDGIGPEITDACRGLITDVFPHWELTEAQIGWSQWCAHGNPVPRETWETLERSDAALLAAITSKPAREAEDELAPHLRGTGLTLFSSCASASTSSPTSARSPCPARPPTSLSSAKTPRASTITTISFRLTTPRPTSRTTTCGQRWRRTRRWLAPSISVATLRFLCA